MFQRLIEGLTNPSGGALRLTPLAAAVAIALFITVSFLCAAAFVFVLEKYGPVEACLAGAAIFFLIALIAGGFYVARKKEIEKEADRTKSAMQNVLSDPMLLSTGVQIVRAIGIKRLLPLLAIGGIALGVLAGRNTDVNDQTPAE
jgi:hypothetical protein